MEVFGEQKNNEIKRKAFKEQLINKAINYHLKGEMSEAIKYYKYCFKEGFKDHRIFSNYGLILQGAGKYKEAEISIRKAIQLKPDFSDAHFNLGIVFISLGELKEAEISIRKAIQLKPEFANYHCNLGNILINLSQFKEAEISTRKAIQLKPDFVLAHFNLGKILINQGKLKESEIALLKAIKLKPDFSEAHFLLGSILISLGKLIEAEKYTRKAIELNPELSEAYCNLGSILISLGKLIEAEKYTRKAIELNPESSEAYCNLGNILKELYKLDAAEIYTRKAIELNPELSEAYCNLGNILQELDKLEEAEFALGKAIEKNPYLSKAYLSLSLFKNTKNNKWKNKLFSDKILKPQREIDLIDIYFARANISEERSNFSQASKYFLKANNINRSLYGSDYESTILKIKNFEKDWDNNLSNLNKKENNKTIIFIVGMPRSGKTITESILACNDQVIKCGESAALEKAIKIFLERKEKSFKPNLYKLFIENTEIQDPGKSIICITTPMNFIYTGLIASEISSAKIIYCYRNPLDNIKEIYKKNMGSKHTYSCSIIESSNLWIKVHQLMKKYKNKFNSKIYNLDYDDLVTDTENKIENLVKWLGWENDKKYLKPNLDKSTTRSTKCLDSKIINKEEISSWKNYESLLKPAIEKFTSDPNLKNLFKY